MPAPQPAMTERHCNCTDTNGTATPPPGLDAGAWPVVSVIIPCYNQGRFLADAIESVLGQTYQRVEIVVVNDGSTDCTENVAASFPSVRCISQGNRGLAEARNTGFAHSSGAFVVFLDADDRLLPHAISRGAAMLREEPALGFVAGHSRFITAQGVPMPTGQPIRPGGDGYLALLRRNSIRNPAMVMFRREALDDVGGFDRRVNACADYDMYLRIARQHPVRFYSDVIAEYRKHGSNMSLDAALMLRQLRRVMRQQRDHLTTPTRREAWDEGLRNAATYYGDLLTTQMRARVRARSGMGRTWWDLLTLLWCHPRGAVEHALRKLSLWRRSRVRAETL